jgi:hypothetical protein
VRSSSRPDDHYTDLLRDPDIHLQRLVRDLATLADTVPSAPPTLTFQNVLARREERRNRQWAARRFMSLRRPVPRLFGVVVAVLLIVCLGGAGYLMVPAIFTVDQGAKTVIMNRLGTELALTRSAHGYVVTITRAYADTNRVIVGYTIHRSSHASSNEMPPFVPVLTMADGQTLQRLGGGARAWDGAYLDNFDAAPIAGNPKSVTLKLVIPLPDTTGARGDGSPFTFSFTVPFMRARVANVHQEQTAAGTTVTLDHVVVSPSETRIYLRGLPGAGIFARLSAGSWDSAQQRGVGILSSIRSTEDGTVVCDFPTSLMDEHGEWTLQIEAGPPTMDGRHVTGGPWLFHFVVP